MEKKIRNAVRTFVISNNRVICIKYKQGDVGYFDIPGGKIENDETPEIAAIREFKEEVGVEISNLEKMGTIIIEYPDKIYNMIVFRTNCYSGEPREFEDNSSFWIEIPKLLLEKKRYATTYLLEPEFLKDFNNKNIKMKFIVDENHQVQKIEK